MLNYQRLNLTAQGNPEVFSGHVAAASSGPLDLALLQRLPVGAPANASYPPSRLTPTFHHRTIDVPWRRLQLGDVSKKSTVFDGKIYLIDWAIFQVRKLLVITRGLSTIKSHEQRPLNHQ